MISQLDAALHSAIASVKSREKAEFSLKATARDLKDIGKQIS